jgi:hypothetical protein
MSNHTHRQKEDHNELVISYKNLRMLVGLMGFALPVSMLLSAALGRAAMQPSISDFYFTRMGDVFVGILCAIGLFLSTYNGYETIDKVASRIAALLALLVAFNPTPYIGTNPCCSFHDIHHAAYTGYIHFGCAAALFLDLALMSLFLFTRTEDKDKRTGRKKIRDMVYIVCGIIMILCIAVVGVYTLDKKLDFLKEYNITFWLETIMLFAFGTSWLVKAEVILGDK